jgi:hypothetical protein
LNIIGLQKLSRVLPAVIIAIGSMTTASASLVYNDAVVVTGLGFGNQNRDLTVQGKGNQNQSSGCVGLAADGSLTFGSCVPDASVYDNNGVQNVGGDEPNPLADNQKYGAPTLASLGINDASDIQIIFDATEAGGGSINIIDLTLKFYNSSNILIGAIDGSQNFASTVPGNGGAGFAFVVSADEQAQVNSWIQGGASRLALEASFTGGGGGPENFYIHSLEAGTPSEVPEPGTWMTLGGGFFGLGALKVFRRFRK